MCAYADIALQWSCVQAYAWRQSQHIDVLELMVFLDFLRFLARSSREHSGIFTTF